MKKKTRVHSVSMPEADYENMKKILKIKNLRFNAVVGDLIKQYIEDNKDLVKKWDETFANM